MTQPCVPVTAVFRAHQEALLPLVRAMTYKDLTDDAWHGKEQMLECSLNIAAPDFREELDRTGRLAALRSGRFSSFACDLGPAWGSVRLGRSPNGYPRYLPGSEPMSEEAFLEGARANVSFLRQRFAGRIKAENLNYFPTGAYEMVCDPAFIARTLRTLQVELLLDIGHLTISAHNLGIPIARYLDCLPLELVSEVQLSRSRVMQGIWEDAHEPPDEEEWEILDWLRAHSTVRYVTVEYYRDGDRLVAAYQELARRLAARMLGQGS